MSLDSVISKDMFCHENDVVFNRLKESLSVDNESIIRMYNYYDSDVYAYGNEVYDNLPIRFVQYLHAQKHGSWHREKNKLTNFWLSDSWPCSVVDIGFGIPHSYILNRISAAHISSSILLVEKFQSALRFARELIEVYSNGDETTKIEYKLFDIDDADYSILSGKDTYILLDVLEHSAIPEKSLARLLKCSKDSSKFILSLPVGEQVPVHSISWKTKTELIDWLKTNGLKPLREKTLAPNPEVDVFIESMNDDFFNVLLECERY